MTEALPVAITSLFPLVLFPFFQILGADETAEEYFNDTTYVFIGSTLVAYAMEKVTKGVKFICTSLFSDIYIYIFFIVGSSSSYHPPSVASRWIEATPSACGFHGYNICHLHVHLKFCNNCNGGKQYRRIAK